jgi:hypothetical protein
MRTEDDDPAPGPTASSRWSGIGTNSAIPVPDPTALTTDAVDRAVRQWRRDLSDTREIIEARLNASDQATLLRLESAHDILPQTERQIDHLRNLLNERFNGVDKVIALLSTMVEKIPEEANVRREMAVQDIERRTSAQFELIRSLIRNVEDVASERFAAVNTRFDERDERTKQAADESRISLDAALAAAKEAVSEQNKANTLAIGKSEAATQKQIDAMTALMTTSNKSLDDKISDLKARLDRGEGASGGATAQRVEARAVSGMNINIMTAIIGLLGLVVAAISIYAALKP